MKLFIDDTRNPPNEDYMVARSYDEAIHILRSKGCPEYISFDHDLGSTDKSGYEIAKWIINSDLNKKGLFIPKNFRFSVHSQNPVGAENIRSALTCYLNERDNRQGL